MKLKAEVETKFNVGDKAYYMYRSKIREVKIINIDINFSTIWDLNPKIFYMFSFENKYIDVEKGDFEDKIFKTKQEVMLNLNKETTQ